MSTLLYNAANKKADHCTVGNHRPTPLRFIWHHILPLAAGGKTTVENQVQLCDNCHYSIHRLMTWLLKASAATDKPWQVPLWQAIGNETQRKYARSGYEQALALGTQNDLPNE